jgi:RNA polymerase sigma-70 factor (ECF subfamily)
MSTNRDDSPVRPEPAELMAPDFTTFMRSYQDMVYSTAVRVVGNAAQAEDIAQEVFVRAYARFDDLGRSATAGGWLKTVAMNLSINHVQRYRKRWSFFSELGRSRDGAADEQPVDFADEWQDPLLGLAAEERRARVDQALEQLPDHQRVPLVLFHFEELPYDEIARRLGVSLAKVKTDILRGRAALARLLSQDSQPEDALFP